jgi:prepilin-type N-terminal cleavage/methylation domain-containing protein
MRKRQGFTLVEMLVAMALIIFIMSILSYAFVAATTTFRDLKAAGDMAERLRSATTVLQRDLSADHFEPGRRLSDPTFWSNGPPRQGFFRIWQGSPSYLRATAPAGTVNFLEGQDLDGIQLYTSVDHALHLTVHLRGNRQSDFFTAKVPSPSPLVPLTGPNPPMGPLTARYENLDGNGTTFNSQWAEVVYFLRPALDSNGIQENANGTPLYTLYRRQLLLVNDNNLVQQYNATTNTWSPHQELYSKQSQYPEISCYQGYPQLSPTQPLYAPNLLYFNSPFDVTVPQRRFGMAMRQVGANYLVYPQTGAGTLGQYPTLAEQTADLNMQNADVLVTDVVSFDIRVMLSTAYTDPTSTLLVYNGKTLPVDPFVDLFHQTIQTFNNGNGLYPAPVPLPPGQGYQQPSGPQVFDTWSRVRDPLTDTLAAQPPVNPFAKYYDYSSWGQNGNPTVNPNQTSQVSIPLWNGTTNTGPILKAIQVQIRVWDNKTQQTRQVTLVQAM